MTYPISRRGERFAVLDQPERDSRQRYTDNVLDRLNTPAFRLLKSRTPDSTLPYVLERAERLRYGRFAVGVEVLPYQIVAVLTDPTGHSIGKRRRDIATMNDGASVAREIGAATRDLVATELGIDLPSARVAIGIQIGGPVNSREGVVLSYANHPADPKYAVDPINWTSPVPLAALVQEETGCRTVIENDAAAYAVYEHKFGVGVETGSFAVILVRDGVGGGLVLDHRVLPIPFEIGHLKVRSPFKVGQFGSGADGRRCPCGNSGCIESVAGRRALRAIVGDLMGGRTDIEDIKRAIDLAEGRHERSEEVLAAFRAGGEAIAQGIATILTMFAVSHVVLYCDEAMVGPGSPRPAVAEFFAGVRSFSEHTFPAFRDCQLVTRRWRSTDGAHGAALVALNQLFFVSLVDPEAGTA